MTNMLVAVTREVSSSLPQCELTFAGRNPIDVANAQQQHAAYRNALSSLNVQIVTLPAQQDLPDAVFVEDAVVVVDEVAVMTRMGSPSRATEIETLAPWLAEYRPLRYLTPPATLDGGDVLRIGRKLYVGLSCRTNSEGVDQLRVLLAPHGYDVESVSVHGCLHLKTGTSFLGQRCILANPNWVHPSMFDGLTAIPVPREEPWGANVLVINDVVLVPSSFPKTQQLLRQVGFRIQPVDISEFQKAEGGLTCLSILFETEKPRISWEVT